MSINAQRYKHDGGTVYMSCGQQTADLCGTCFVQVYCSISNTATRKLVQAYLPDRQRPCGPPQALPPYPPPCPPVMDPLAVGTKGNSPHQRALAKGQLMRPDASAEREW